MSDLVSYAEQELRKAGLFDKDSDYDGDIGPAALEIVKAFSEQGHSGFSAALVTNIVQKLMKFEPLSPLTGEDDEWSLICDERTSQKAVYQNKRCFSVFKEDGVSYHVQGKIFREPNAPAIRIEIVA